MLGINVMTDVFFQNYENRYDGIKNSVYNVEKREKIILCKYFFILLLKKKASTC